MILEGRERGNINNHKVASLFEFPEIKCSEKEMGSNAKYKDLI